jgi:hypothetical protein
LVGIEHNLSWTHFPKCHCIVWVKCIIFDVVILSCVDPVWFWRVIYLGGGGALWGWCTFQSFASQMRPSPLH